MKTYSDHERLYVYRESLAIAHLELGSTRALACSDRRPRRTERSAMELLNLDPLERLFVVGEGADHGTRGRVRSPERLRGSGLDVLLAKGLPH